MTAGWIGFSFAFGSLWASDPIAQTLGRIDPSNGGTLAARDGVNSTGAAVAGFGSLWLAGATLQRLDPMSLAVVNVIPLHASMVAAGSGAVWVLSHGEGKAENVVEIDPRTNSVVGRPIAVAPK